MNGLIDIHCHIIPDVDDGPRTEEEAVALLRLQKRQGVDTIIATPHYRKRMFTTDMRYVRRQFRRLQNLAEREGIRLFLGCEIHECFQMAEVMEEKNLSTMAGSRYVLLEFSGATDYKEMKTQVYHLRSNGYRPIIAHIERYEAIRKKPDLADELKEMGARIQVNAESVMGQSGFMTKMFCKNLIRRDVVSFIGSDSHDTKHRIPNLGKCADYLTKKYGRDYARTILIDNPEKILRGE